MRLNTTRSALLALGFLLLLVLTGLPLAIGVGAQRAYQALLRSTYQALPVGWVLVEQYERGWFSSHATAELTRQPATGPAPAAQPTRIRLDSRIDQSPWSWFSAGLFPAAAHVTTRADWVDGPIPLPPLFIDTTVGADGSGRAHLLVPASNQSTGQSRPPDGDRLLNQTITGTLYFRPSPPRAALDLRIPSVGLDTAAGPRARLTGTRIKAELTDWSGGIATGHISLATASARFNPAPQTSPTGQEALVEQLTLTLEQAPSEPAPARRLNLKLNAAADLLRLDGIAYRSPVVGLSAQSLDAQTVTDIAGALRTLSSEAATPAMRGLVGATLLAQLLPRLMASSPSVELNPFTLSTPDGPVAGHLALAVKGHDGPTNGAAAVLGALLGGGPANWLNALTGDGDLALPRPIALAWLARADATGTTSPADQLQALSDGGWITAQDGRIASTLRLASGKLRINGKKIRLSWPGLGG